VIRLLFDKQTLKLIDELECKLTVGSFIYVAAAASGTYSPVTPIYTPKDIQNQIDNLTVLIESMAARMPEQGKKVYLEQIIQS